MTYQRWLAAGLACLTLASLANTTYTASASSDYVGGWQPEYPIIKYGVISVETAIDTLKSQKAFADYMSKELGVKVEVYTATEYAGIVNALASGQIQMGWLGASSYASTWLDCQCVEPLAGAQTMQGEMGYYSVLIVKAESPYRKYEDLKGKIVARNDPNSTSGFLIPTLIFHEMGKPLGKYFRSPLSGGHQQTVVGVLNGTYDAGFVWTSQNDGFGAIRKMVDKDLLRRDQIRIIWRSPLIPTPPVVIRNDLPAAMKRDLEKIFTSLYGTHPELAETVAQGKTMGLRRVFHEDYLPIINAKQLLKERRKWR